MKNKRFKAVSAFLAAALCLCTFTACGQNNNTVSSSPAASNKGGSSVTDAKKSSSGKEANAGELIIVEDPLGLATLHIEDGKAKIRLDPEKWEELYDVELRMDFSNPETFIPVRTDAETVRDACIGEVSNFSAWHGMWTEFPVPMLIMVMDDGTIESAGLDPVIFDPHLPYINSYSTFTQLGNIVSLLWVENDGEGIGGPTVYATSSDGLRYNLAKIFTHSISDPRSFSWYCSLDYENNTTQRFGYLTLDYDGTAIYEIGAAPDKVSKYKGSYEIVFAEDQKYPAGTIVLNLTLVDSNDPQIAKQKSIKGSYVCEMGVQDIYMQLWQNDGDSLNAGAENPQMEYGFQEDEGSGFNALKEASSADLLGTWVAFNVVSQEGVELTLFLEFGKDNRMEYFYGYPNSDIVERFEGSYYIVQKTDDGLYEPGTILFDMSLTGGLAMEDDTEPYDFSGAYKIYRSQKGEEATITVIHIDGDSLLYGKQGDSITFAESMG